MSQATNQTPRWDAEVLARIEHLHLRARELVLGFLHATHPSARSSRNVEFSEYKEYSPGDSLRDLDWRVAARSDRLVVRRHRAETELATTILVDASGDMGTGEAGLYGRRPPLDASKWGTAAVLCSTLAYWLHRRAEPVGLMVLGGEDVPWRYLPPRTGRTHLARILSTLGSARPAGEANLGQGITTLGSRLPRRSLAVIVSDLMEEPARWGPALVGLGERRADVRLVHLADPKELGLELREAGRLYSPEGGEELVTDPEDARAAFAEVVAAYQVEVAGWVRQARAQRIVAQTDASLQLPLSQLLRGA